MARPVLPLIALAVALALLYLGVPHFMSALQEARFGGVAEAVARGEPVPDERLSAAIAGLESALSWIQTRDTHIELALLYQARADRAASGTGTRRAAIDTALAHYRSGLALAPLDPLAWSRLGWLLASSGQSREALAAVRFSTLIGAFAPEQLWWRLELWLRLLPELGSEDVSLLRRQMVFAFEEDPARLARLAGRHRLLHRLRRELADAGIEAERLDAHFPVPFSPASTPN